MKPNVATARALAAYAGHRAIRFITWIVLIVLGVVFLVVGLLTYFFSTWWLLLALPFIAIGLVFLLMRWLIMRLIHTIYRHPFTRKQREQLEAFADKVMRLADARSISPPMFALRTLWDLVRRRDATTIRSIISDSSTLRSDFRELEKAFTS